MKSVADILREEQRLRERQRTPEQRVARALRLGRRLLALYAQAHGCTVAEAYRLQRRQRQRSRRPCTCLEEPQ